MTAKDRVHRYLEDNRGEWCAQAGMRESLKLTKGTFSSAIHALRHAGVTIQNQRGSYRIPMGNGNVGREEPPAPPPERASVPRPDATASELPAPGTSFPQAPAPLTGEAPESPVQRTLNGFASARYPMSMTASVTITSDVAIADPEQRAIALAVAAINGLDDDAQKARVGAYVASRFLP